MAIFKNVTSQKIAVYAHDTSADAPKTGDAANITAQISLDGGATAATNDTNPTELDATDAKGIYIFDMAQAETNADLVILSAVSATSSISIEPVIIYTLPVYNDLSLAQIFANDLESGKTFAQAVLDVWAVTVGNAAADDATDPTSITYDSPDDSVQRTHALTDTARTVS